MDFLIREGSISEAMAISRLIPEFTDPYPMNVYKERLDKKPHLILVALRDQRLIGFKIGYERSGFWYSWLGGVLPDFRRKGVATSLAIEQEKWAIKAGYSEVTLKSRNCHKNMLLFALKHGFKIVGFDSRNTVDEHRIWFKKKL